MVACLRTTLGLEEARGAAISPGEGERVRVGELRGLGTSVGLGGHGECRKGPGIPDGGVQLRRACSWACLKKFDCRQGYRRIHSVIELSQPVVRH